MKLKKNRVFLSLLVFQFVEPAFSMTRYDRGTEAILHRLLMLFIPSLIFNVLLFQFSKIRRPWPTRIMTVIATSVFLPIALFFIFSGGLLGSFWTIVLAIPGLLIAAAPVPFYAIYFSEFKEEGARIVFIITTSLLMGTMSYLVFHLMR